MIPSDLTELVHNLAFEEALEKAGLQLIIIDGEYAIEYHGCGEETAIEIIEDVVKRFKPDESHDEK